MYNIVNRTNIGNIDKFTIDITMLIVHTPTQVFRSTLITL
jgi:hypothetical protein